MRRLFLFSTLVILLLCDASVGSRLFGILNERCVEDGANVSLTSGNEESASERMIETEEYADELSEENAPLSGETIDLIDDEVVACVSGESTNLYYPECKGDDEENYYMSNHGNRYKHILWCGGEKDTEVFYLDKEYSTLTIELGIWEKSKESSNMLTIYSGMGENENKEVLLNARLEKGDKEQQYLIDVSDVEYLSIEAVALDSQLGNYVVTDGVKLTHK